MLTVFQMNVSFYVSTHSAESSSCSTFSPDLGDVRLFHFGHSGGRERDLTVGLLCISLMPDDAEHVF